MKYKDEDSDFILANVLTRLGDPDTSKDAAGSIDGFKSAEKVFWTIREARASGGASNAELTKILHEKYHMPSQSINSTCSRLRDAGFIMDSGERRLGDYGVTQIVWIDTGAIDIFL